MINNNTIKNKNDNFSKINEIIEIEKVARTYLDIIPRGNNKYFALCPYHQEKTPSFCINKDKQYFYCFGCKKSGTALDLIAKIQNISKLETYWRIAKEYNIPISVIETKGMHLDVNNLNNDIMKVNKITALFYNNNLLSNKISQLQQLALDYLKSRGITKYLINKFEIGLDNNSDVKGESLYTFLKKYHKISDLAIKSSKLIVLKESNNLKTIQARNFMSERITFPIININNQYLNIIGRAFTIYKEQKYLITSSTEIFKKGEYLYNEHLASIEDKKDEIFLVEGVFDVILLTKIDIKKTVASLGSSLTNVQIEKLKQLSSTVVIVFDNDKAGLAQAKKISLQLLKQSINVKIIILDNTDPAEYIQQQFTENKDITNEQIKNKILNKRIDIVEYIINNKKNEYLTEKGLDNMIKLNNITNINMFISDIAPFILACQNNIAQLYYLKKIRSILSLPNLELSHILNKTKPLHKQQLYFQTNQNKINDELVINLSKLENKYNINKYNISDSQKIKIADKIWKKNLAAIKNK